MWINIVRLILASSVSADDYDTCRQDCLNDKGCMYVTFEQGKCRITTAHGTVKSYPATSCLQAHKDGGKNNGLYWIDTPSGAVQTFCDMENGGWTLVGEVGGTNDDKYLSWLRDNHNVEQLQDTEIQAGSYSCLDAVNIAVNHATMIRLSNSGKDGHVGSKWVTWLLPTERDTATFWNLTAVSPDVNRVATVSEVTVQYWTGQTSVCYQRKYGMQNFAQHGGSYPSTSYHNNYPHVSPHDGCMSVSVMATGGVYNGWYQYGNGRDCPKDDEDWPNAAYGTNCFLAVWLK